MIPRVRVLATPDDVANAARERFVELGRAAIEARGRFDVSLAGGTTPERFFRLLQRDDLDWTRVRIFFGDERCVPPEHAQSNYRMARESFLERVGVPEGNVERMRGEIEPARAAKEYELVLDARFGPHYPRFDLCLMGLGADGHSASLFPGTSALEERERTCVATWVEKLDAWRITLTFPVIEASACVLFVACGADKRDAFARVTVETPTSDTPPAGLVRPRDGTLEWIVDRAVAG